ncbi:hypothetical protein L2E82_10614 [Cichorium intybus]|uniref:Uncharacterized protein n=1 Tax=Cichorium intybus TaxID=13427 RepID=A0ACB9GAV3_CICIN|nr:hypothetical protein L2E82_10614 [Cichorium intybus]
MEGNNSIWQERKTLHDQSTWVPLAEVQLDEKLRYQEMPEKILEKKVKKLRNKEVGLVKVQWRHHRGSDVTWEAGGEMRVKYPYLFQEIPRTESFEGAGNTGRVGGTQVVFRSRANRGYSVEKTRTVFYKPGPCFVNRGKQRIFNFVETRAVFYEPGPCYAHRSSIIQELKLGFDSLRLKAKARQEHTRGAGVPHIDSTIGSGSADHGKRITEG